MRKEIKDMGTMSDVGLGLLANLRRICSVLIYAVVLLDAYCLLSLLLLYIGAKFYRPHGIGAR